MSFRKPLMNSIEYLSALFSTVREKASSISFLVVGIMNCYVLKEAIAI
jgi:hypothetical protein